MSNPDVVSATIQADYEAKTGVATLVVVGTQPKWLTLSQGSGSWIIAISTSDNISIDLIPGRGLVSIAGFGFDQHAPSSKGTFAAGSWQPDTTGKGILLSDTAGTRGSWDFMIEAIPPFGGSVTFDPKIYNEGGG